MAAHPTSVKNFRFIVANRQIPQEQGESIYLELPGIGPNNSERTFVQKKFTTPVHPRQHDTVSCSSEPAPYSRFQWIDSSIADESKSQPFHPPKRRHVDDRYGPRKLRLNGKSPLKTGSTVSEDIWRIIFSCCDPKLLLNLRYVCTMFRRILQESRIWRESRETTFGASMPRCPFFLNEIQYVDLLAGSGCQNSWCLRRETRKANWIFRGRLCEDCLRQKTNTDAGMCELQSINPCPELLANSALLGVPDLSYLDLIPTAYHESGKYYAPRRIDSNTGKWYGTSHRSQGLLYLKSDYRKLEGELAIIKNESWELSRVIDWAKAKYEAALRYGRVAEEMFHFEVSMSPYRWNYGSARAQSERDRESFFIRKASELPEPIEADVLPIFAAYQSALLTCNKPSERSWQLLLPKILPYLEEAKRIKQYKLAQPHCHINNTESEWSEDAKLFKRLHDHRHVSHVETGKWMPEQDFIRNLGRQEFTQLDGQIPDEDLILMCLRNVYDRYEQLEVKPRGMNFDGFEDIYKLSLDDARMIVEDIIQPQLDRRTLRSVAVLRSFKCAGCTRTEKAKKYTFRSCFEHIREVHSVRVGKDLAFSRFARNAVRTSASHLVSFSNRSLPDSHFPWYIIAWTRTLPLLPLHTVVTKDTKWDPDSDEPYPQLATTQAVAGASIFGERQPIRHTDATQRDFRANLTFAVGAFEPTRLDSASVIKVALRYAQDLEEPTRKSLGQTGLSREELIGHLKAARVANPALMFKFQCGLCSHQPDADKHTRCARTPVDLTRLYNHWQQKHKDDSGDTQATLIDLPSDAQLKSTFEKHDEALRNMQSQSIERETIGLKKSYRKKPDYKATILMSKPMAMDIFDTLFMPDNTDNKDETHASTDLL